MTSNFERPLKVYYTDDNNDFYCFGRATYSVFYDQQDQQISPNYEFVTDPAEAEVLAVKFIQNLDEILSDIPKLQARFQNLKLVILARVFHISGHMSQRDNLDIEKRLDEINHKATLPYVMMLTMDTRYHKNKHTNSNNIFYTDYIYNTMVMLYKDQPSSIFDTECGHGMHWWWSFGDNDTLGLRRENYNLHDLLYLPTWEGIKNNAGTGGVPKLYVSPSRTRLTEKFNRHLSAYKDWNSHDDSEVLRSSYQHRDYLRNELQSLLSNYPGFLGDGSKNSFLVGEGVTPLQLENCISNMDMPGNVPINNEYYRHSALTINIETLAFTDLEDQSPRCVTEKTFETILKGHFPLTFAYKDFYRDLEHIYNIRLPDWIDYSFDSEPDNLKRWIQYKLEVTRVLNLGAKKLFAYRTIQVDDLLHNRAMILDRGLRNPVHDAIAEFLEHCKTLPQQPADILD